MSTVSKTAVKLFSKHNMPNSIETWPYKLFRSNVSNKFHQAYPTTSRYVHQLNSFENYFPIASFPFEMLLPDFSSFFFSKKASFSKIRPGQSRSSNFASVSMRKKAHHEREKLGTESVNVIRATLCRF